jgi:hypothetical protein
VARSGTTATNQICIHEKIKSRLGILDTIQFRIFSLRLLSKNLQIKIHKTIILPLVSYGCETWSLTLRNDHRLRVFQKSVLRRIFRPKRKKVAGGWRRLHNEELIIYTLHQILLG